MTQKTAKKNQSKTRIAFLDLYLSEATNARSLGIEAIAGHIQAHLDVSRYEIRYWKFTTGDERLIQQSEVDLSTCISELEGFAPDMIGISVFCNTTNLLFKLMQLIDQARLSPLVVLGGLTAIYAYQELLEQFPGVVIAIGEGEETILPLLQYVNGQIELDQIPNIAFLDEKSRQPVITDRKLLDLQSVNYLPSMMSVHPVEANKFYWIESSRGCSSHCTFCSQHGFGRRQFALQRVIGEIAHLYENCGITKFAFSDELFFSEPQRVMDFASAILERNIKIKIQIDTRIDTLYSPDESPGMAQSRERAWLLLKKAGLVYVVLGIESGSDSQLKRFGKSMRAEQNQIGLAKIDGYSINYYAGWILFDPLVNIQELKETVLFLEKTKAHYHIGTLFKSMRVQRGTPYPNLLRSHGLLKGLEENLLYYDYDFKYPFAEDLCNTPSTAFKELSGCLNWNSNLYETETSFANVIEELKRFNRLVKDTELDFLKEYIDLYEAGGNLEKARKNFYARVWEVTTEIMKTALVWKEAPSPVSRKLAGDLSHYINNLREIRQCEDRS